MITYSKPTNRAKCKLCGKMIVNDGEQIQVTYNFQNGQVSSGGSYHLLCINKKIKGVWAKNKEEIT